MLNDNFVEHCFVCWLYFPEIEEEGYEWTCNKMLADAIWKDLQLLVYFVVEKVCLSEQENVNSLWCVKTVFED